MATIVPLSWLHSIAGDLPVQRIGRDNDPYLDRFYIGRTRGLTFYLHRFLRPDHVAEGRHNHPWPWGRSIVLHGSYMETRREVIPLDAQEIADTDNWLSGQVSTHHVWLYNYLGNDTFHRVEALSKSEVWTLFWHPNWQRKWGFLREDGFRVASGRVDGTTVNEWWTHAPLGRTVL